MKIIFSLLSKSMGLTVLAVGAGIVAGIGNTVLLGLIHSGLSDDARPSAAMLWGFIGLCVVVSAGRFVSGDLLMRFAQSAMFDMRTKLSRQIVNAPLRLQEEVGASRILAVLTEDIPAITGAMTSIPTICTNLVIVLGCLLYLGSISWKVLVGVVVFMVIGIVSCQLPVLRATRYMKQARNEADSLQKQFRAMTEGGKELKIHRRRREAFLSKLLTSTAQALRRNNVVSSMVFNAVNSWAQSLIFILIGLLVFLPRPWVGLDTQSLTGYILILLFMIGPLVMVMSAFPALTRADVAMKKMKELGFSLAAQPTDVPAAEDVEGGPPWTGLELRGVTHTFFREKENGTFTLGPLDLRLDPGEVVFVTGGNGSGKTTLAKLLTGLYAPEAGEIRFNGEAVTDENRDEYRQLFSVVFSDFYIFETLLGLDTPDLDEQARHYLRQLQIDHKVQIEGGALSTVDLSQGQRKRLALLTAYLEDRPVYVFDEWAADQDPLFKEVFYYELVPGLKARGKAVLVISHDDRYYQVADRVIKLDYGRLVEEQPAALAPPQPALATLLTRRENGDEAPIKVK